jgi:hypothetical protein
MSKSRFLSKKWVRHKELVAAQYLVAETDETKRI